MRAHIYIHTDNEITFYHGFIISEKRLFEK